MNNQKINEKTNRLTQVQHGLCAMFHTTQASVFNYCRHKQNMGLYVIYEIKLVNRCNF